MLKTCPHFLRGRLRESFQVALRERHRAKMAQDEQAEIRAWKFFGLVPLMFMHIPSGTGAVGRSQLASGRWSEVMTDVPRNCPHRARPRADKAQVRVRCGQISRARQGLTGATPAPKNASTLLELRARRPQEQLREIPREVMDFISEKG